MIQVERTRAKWRPKRMSVNVVRKDIMAYDLTEYDLP